MNAITSTTRHTFRPGGNDRLLRLAVRIDAWVSGAFGLVLLAGGGLLGSVLGIPVSFLIDVGAVCLIYAGVLWLLQTRAVVGVAAGWSLVIANTAWVIASIALVVVGWLAMTPLGVGFVLLQALVVAGLADLQFVGVRRTAQSMRV